MLLYDRPLNSNVSPVTQLINRRRFLTSAAGSGQLRHHKSFRATLAHIKNSRALNALLVCVNFFQLLSGLGLLAANTRDSLSCIIKPFF
jgi:hypothetical protein